MNTSDEARLARIYEFSKDVDKARTLYERQVMRAITRSGSVLLNPDSTEPIRELWQRAMECAEDLDCVRRGIDPAVMYPPRRL
jgi:hypothetical protein